MATETMNLTCAICVETFNRTIRKKVSCQSCQTDICGACIKRFLADTVQEPNCMNCHELYSTDFLDANFTKAYRKSALSKVRTHVIVEREKRHLPELQHRAAALKHFDRLVEEENNLRTEYYKTEEVAFHLKASQKNYALIVARKDMKDTDLYKDAAEEMKRIQGELQLVNAVLKDIRNTMDVLQEEQSKYHDIYNNGGTKAVETIVRCVKEGCKGFLDESTSKCGLCNTQACLKCHLEISEDECHVCKQEDIDTVTAISNETKPCPTCNTRIFRDYGCDQMWCTQCHTTFNWHTGKIEHGRIHNPHYLQWVRARKNAVSIRELGDVPCGGLPLLSEVQNKLQDIGVSNAYRIYASVIYKLTQTIATKEMNKYPVVHGRTEEMNIISIQYLANRISEPVWTAQLFKTEQVKEMNKEHRQILDMMLAVLVDYFHRITTEIESEEHLCEIINEIEQLRIYFNTVSGSLNKRFDCKSFKSIPFDWAKFT